MTYPIVPANRLCRPVRKGPRLRAVAWAAAAGMAAPMAAPAFARGGGAEDGGREAPQAVARTYPTNSSPIAITADDQFVWSVNPDSNSVSVFKVAGDYNQKWGEIAVGREPWCVALTPKLQWADGYAYIKAYVANMVSGTVSVIDNRTRTVVETIRVGTEPFGCALTPDGRKLFVANQSSQTVSVIDTRTDKVIETIAGVGSKPHGIAITADGRKVYVTQLLSDRPAPGERRPRTQSEGADDGRAGRVTVIDATTYYVTKTAVLYPLPDTGFKSDGNTLGREPVTTTFDNVTGAFPNLLESVAIRGNVAYVPGTCSSPNGPFRFNVNVQSCLSSIDITADTEAFGKGSTLNMNVGVGFEPVGKKLFNTNPFAVAFKRSKREGFVALGATDRLLRVTLGVDGRPTINPPASATDAGRIVRIELKDPTEIGQADADYTIGGKNPRGLVLNSTDTRAYVMDYGSRDIAIVDVSGLVSNYKTIARLPSADLPAAGTVAAIVQRGKLLFNSALGPSGTGDNARRPAGRMSDTGWGTCYSCHVNGLTDSVTWMFADGPRQSISMENTFTFRSAVIRKGAPKLPDSHQRALNWSAVRDEVQDFTRNVRAVSGGAGLVLEDANGQAVPEGAAGLPQLPDLVPTASTGLNKDLDAIATYLALGVRAPIAPLKSNSPGVAAGRQQFQWAGCQNCHGGKDWTTSILDYTPAPAATEITDGQLARFLCRVGTFDTTAFSDGKGNEIRANNAANVQSRGVLGFNVPSLISVFASPPYLHSGAALTLDAVLENVTHRSAGNGGVDTLSDPADRKALVRFLKSIDRTTTPFLTVNRPADVCGPTQ